IHTRIGEQQGRIVMRDERGRMHLTMLFVDKEVEKLPPNFGTSRHVRNLILNDYTNANSRWVSVLSLLQGNPKVKVVAAAPPLLLKILVTRRSLAICIKQASAKSIVVSTASQVTKGRSEGQNARQEPALADDSALAVTKVTSRQQGPGANPPRTTSDGSNPSRFTRVFSARSRPGELELCTL